MHLVNNFLKTLISYIFENKKIIDVQPSYIHCIDADHTLIQANHHIYYCWWRYIHSHEHYWCLRPTNGFHHSVNNFTMSLIGTMSNQFRYILKKMALPHGPYACFPVESLVCRKIMYIIISTSLWELLVRDRIVVGFSCVYWY